MNAVLSLLALGVCIGLVALIWIVVACLLIQFAIGSALVVMVLTATRALGSILSHRTPTNNPTAPCRNTA